ncbi:MAG: ABC transporter ATP-binding protein [Oscillospiraceae bacterium]|nr:ABC transporter ATP-binding protein [Oscillospiraceae bacterium]
MQDTVLSVQHLSTSFFTDEGELKAVDDISYDVHQGEFVALIGESGSGKSVSALSILRLVGDPPGKIVGGKVLFHDTDLLQISDKEMQEVRGSKISMIFQEPATALNPVMTIGNQIAEPLRVHKKMSKQQAFREAASLLSKMKIPNVEQRIKQYPMEFSGGMQQRAMIAMAMSCQPEILIADEPTTALDVTVQAQVLEELNQLRLSTNTAILLITHNLGLVARYADSVKIMYGGRILEMGSTYDIFENPHHPYTLGLIRAVPRLDQPKSYGLHTIKGEPASQEDRMMNNCLFVKRCKYATDICWKQQPKAEEISEGHMCACFHADFTAAEREELLR